MMINSMEGCIPFRRKNFCQKNFFTKSVNMEVSVKRDFILLHMERPN